MNIKKLISERSFVYCLIGNLLIMAFYFMFFTCFFETCDDFIMKMIAAGSFTGTPDNHLIYIGTFLGSIMAFLYNISPHIAWYEIVQVAIMLMSFSTISYVLIRKHRKFEILIWLLMFALSYSFYVSFQFTKTTAVPTIAGYLLIADVLDNNDKNYKLIFALILLFMGMSLRFNQFFVCSFVVAPVFIPVLLDFLKDHKTEENRNKVLKLMAVAGLAFLLVVVSVVIRNVNYGSDSWKYYLKFNDLSTELLDRGFPDYEENEELYKELKIDRDFFESIKRNNFYDPEIFNEETINKLISAKDKTISFGYVYEFFYVSIRHFFDNDYIRPYSIILVAMFVICLITGDRKSVFVAFVTMIFMIAAVFICYYIRANHFYTRISISFLTVASLVMIYLANLNRYHPSLKGMSIIATVSVVVWCCLWFDDIWINGEGNRQLSEYRTEIAKTLAEDQEHLYIYSTLDRFWVNELLFKDISYLKFTNVQSLGEWVTYSPFIMDTWNRYEIVNPFKDIVNNDRVYFFIRNGDNSLDSIMNHIRINYYNNAEAIPVDNIADYIVYKVVSE